MIRRSDLIKDLTVFITVLSFSYNIFSLDQALTINRESLMVPHRLGDISVMHDNEGFHVVKDKTVHTVKKQWVDKKLRNVKKEQLRAFLKTGYLSVNQSDADEYGLEAKVRGDGGGPLLGALFYTLTKVACYGTAAAATGTVIVATGGALGAAASVAAASTTLGAGSAVTLTAAAISGAGLTATATELTVGNYSDYWEFSWRRCDSGSCIGCSIWCRNFSLVPAIIKNGKC